MPGSPSWWRSATPVQPPRPDSGGSADCRRSGTSARRAGCCRIGSPGPPGKSRCGRPGRADRVAGVPEPTAADLRALPRQLARTHHFSMGAPNAFTLSRNGRTVFFLRSKAGDDPVTCLWAQDCETGEERLLADPRVLLAGATEQVSAEEQTRRERTRQLGAGIVSYAADDAGELLAFALSGQLWAVSAGDGGVRMLGAAEPVMDPRPDPTGTRIGYVSGGALRVVEADGTGDRAVATPEHQDVSYGLAEHVASESMQRYRGYWWAPDGSALLIARVDNSQVQRWYISDPADPAKPPRAMAYPSVGTANAVVSLWIADLAAATEHPALIAVDWDNRAMEYLTEAGWDETGPYAAVECRDQQLLQILGIDAATGQTSVLAEQRDDAWITLVRGLPARTASGLLVSSTDSADTRRLTVGGHQVTPPGLQLDAVASVHGERVLFTASDEPTELHLWSYDTDNGLVKLSDEVGVHVGVQRADTTVLVSGAPDRPGQTVTVSTAGLADGRPRQQIASRAERPVLDVRMELMSLALASCARRCSCRPGTPLVTGRCPCCSIPTRGQPQRRCSLSSTGSTTSRSGGSPSRASRCW